MVDTLTLDNNGTAAWEVTTFSGASITTQIGVDNPDIDLSIIGTRYEITNDGHPSHPLEFLDDQDNALLSQSSTGSFESDSGVNWVDNDTSVEFTLTQGLSNQLTTYRCTVHTGAMVGNIISPEIDYTPNTGSVSITSPAEGAVVTSPFDVVMQATDFTIEAASNGPTDGAGHFHILVDQDAIAAGQAIPNNPANGYYHYGDGSTTATLDLDPGATTIRIQAGTANHLAYDLTDSVDIIVESDIQGTPIINAIDNVNQASLETVFAAVAADPTARDSLSQSDRNIDKVSTNVGVIESLNNNEEAIREMLCRREGRDPANFADLDAVAADQGLMQAIAARQESSKILARSQKASAAAAASQTAMQEVVASQTALPEMAASQTAMQGVAASQVAMQEVAASQTAMQEVAALQTAMQEVVASQTAMQEVAALQTAMQEVVASQTARDEVFASQTAMQEVAASQTAMQEVLASQTALSEMAASQAAGNALASSAVAVSTFEAASTSGNNSVPAPTDSPMYIAELSGGGGGGTSSFYGNYDPGTDGSDTTFHETTAGGGDAGGGSDGSDGGFTVNSPDILINGSNFGGADGGYGGGQGGDGGNGGFVKALIMNPDQQTLSLNIGNGGSSTDPQAGDGDNGSATIFTP
jgi:hypothetical protein